jgi:DNA-binding NarL/FixJ family response regulator
MPGMNGQTLAEKSLELRPDLAVIICSGDMERADTDQLDRMGRVSTLSKPVDGRGLAGALRKALTPKAV